MIEEQDRIIEEKSWSKFPGGKCSQRNMKNAETTAGDPFALFTVSTSQGKNTQQVRWADEDDVQAAAPVSHYGCVEPPVQDTILNNVTERNAKWTSMKLTVDSGACDHVLCPQQAPTPIKPSAASFKGVRYLAASGHEMPNLGEVLVRGLTREGNELGMTMPVAEVQKPLCSVRKMCTAGNRVVFEENTNHPDLGGYVENIGTGTRIPIRKLGGTYQVELWTQPVQGQNRVASLQEHLSTLTDSEVNNVGEDEGEAPDSGNAASSSGPQRPVFGN